MRVIHPFIGSNYHSAGLRGTKLLIVGESSYNPGEHPDGYDFSQATINLAADAIGWDQGHGYRNKSRFYSRIVRIFGFNPNHFTSRHEFWNSVSYYNYLQTTFLAARVLPPAEAWNAARDPFIETASELRPDYIVIFSKRMWPYVPKTSEAEIPNPHGVFARYATVEYPKQPTAMLIGFKHPTAPRFRWQDVKYVLDQHIKFHEAYPITKAAS
jgi:hypothetical protein